ncbi:MAG: IS200/IS605 family transposase [Bacteroidota bacterium]
MPYSRIWIHLVWSTKHREPLLNSDIRSKLFSFMKTYGKNKDIFIEEINGHEDHIHCLLRLKTTQSVSQVAKLLKGASSFWINNEQLIEGKLYWQSEYFAASVGESELSRIRKYIQIQEEKHSSVSFEDELKSFIKNN